MIIGCDIGGVVRDLATGNPVPGALEGLAQLAAAGHSVVFISKCGENIRAQVLAWLAQHGIASLPIHFCSEDSGKAVLAEASGISAMVDDRVQVLRTLPGGVLRVWLCREEQKVAGTRKHHPELLQTLQLARTWQDVVGILEAHSADKAAAGG